MVFISTKLLLSNSFSQNIPSLEVLNNIIVKFILDFICEAYLFGFNIAFFTTVREFNTIAVVFRATGRKLIHMSAFDLEVLPSLIRHIPQKVVQRRDIPVLTFSMNEDNRVRVEIEYTSRSTALKFSHFIIAFNNRISRDHRRNSYTRVLTSAK